MSHSTSGNCTGTYAAVARGWRQALTGSLDHTATQSPPLFPPVQLHCDPHVPEGYLAQ
jgi:hypothetical protein